MTENSHMGWYKEKIVKVAFPYGKICCPSKKCKLIGFCWMDDFGYRDMSAGGTSTQNTESPHIDHEITKYDDSNPNFQDDSVQDMTERGVIIRRCPNCGKWLQVEYEYDTKKGDFEARPTEIFEVSEEEAKTYMGMGVPGGYKENEYLQQNKQNLTLASKVEYKDWAEKLGEIHNKRDVIQSAAKQICESLGHVLFAFNPFNSSRCRKCGRTVYCHNIFASTSSPDFVGSATSETCPASLDGDAKHTSYKKRFGKWYSKSGDKFEFTDYSEPRATNTVL
jgi:hypothetical protein